MKRVLRRVLHGLGALVRRKPIDDELEEELDAFLDEATDHHRRRGRSPEDARRAASLEVGSRAVVKDHVRDMRWESVLEDMWRDVVYGCRYLGQHRGFAAAAVLTLGLGIGISTAVFSLVNTVLLQPLPYKDANRLVRVVERAAPPTAGAPLLRRISMRWPEMVEWRTRSTTLSELAYTLTPPITLMTSNEGAVRLSGALVSANLFRMLGAEAALGRTLDVRDEAPGADVVVLSASTWRRYFGGQPDIVGQTVALKSLGPQAGFLDGRPLTIVGVMPPTFDYPVPYAEFWAPIAEDSPLRRWPGSGLVIGRLAEGVSVEAAADEANVIGEGLRPRPTSGPLARPLPAGARRFDVESIKEQAVAASRPALRALSIAVGVLLLIVCANVAGLLLARGLSRQREIAVRVALGAGRGRVIRQLVTESGLLALAGGASGVLLAAGLIHVLRVVASPNADGPFLISFGGAMVPRLHEVSIDPTMLGIAATTSAVTAILVGVVPSISLLWTDHGRGTALFGAGSAQRGATAVTSRLQDALLAGQVAMATVLLVGAGLVVGSFGRLVRLDPGWHAPGLLTFYLAMPQEYDTDRRAVVVGRLLEELRTIPGVAGAGFTYAGPLLGLVDGYGVFVPPGKTAQEMGDNPDNPELRSVSHAFLETMGAKLIAGRWLEPGDDAGAPPVLIVNRTVARRLFAGQDPVGQLVHFDGRMDLPPQRIVGVVEDLRQARFDQEPVPQMFFDYRQLLELLRERNEPAAQQERLVFGFHSFVVRTESSPSALMPTVRQRIRRVDSNLGIDAMMPMEQLVAASLTRQRFYAVLIGVFAATAAALSAIGIYGVLAYGVARRTSEIGVRMALGAEAGAIRLLILRRGLGLFAAGLLVGLGGAAVLARFLRSMLYGVTPLDPATYVAAAVLFSLIVTLACWVPARRATRVDPLVALRSE
jgi:predicted permease